MRTEESLNGWWDFRPEPDPKLQSHHRPASIPARGWLPGAILVPGSWTRGGCGDPAPDPLRPWLAWRLFDNYGYPPGWGTLATAWYHRTFSAQPAPGTRWRLAFDGVLRCAWVFVNGQPAGHIAQGIMPAEFDITALVRDGANELHVCVTEYPADEKGKWMVPAGADQVIQQRGIWQNVRLVSHPDVWIDDATIRTSVRQNELAVTLSLRNDGDTPRTVRPTLAVRDASGTHLAIHGESLSLDPRSVRTIAFTRPWTSYQPWSPHSPHLYQLQSRLAAPEGSLIDERIDRFGFREVWTEGRDILLNGSPVHLFGDWCHKNTLENFRPEYIRQWFRMLKDCNMNYIRTHMFPHPRVMLDLADEMGILVSLESAFAFGGSFALDRPEFWAAAEQHVRDIVRRDKNHPSIILWSAGNEVRWSGNREPIVRNYPRLMQLYRELDPTRIVYADGDSSLWDERTQALISRHYGNECTGEIGWDGSQPLHVGEVGSWHFAQPNDSGIWCNDSVFASVFECHRAMAREVADMAETARSNGVCCFFPWNLSGLDNFRPWPEERRHEWLDPSAPHVKPLRSPPYSSEFAWWDPDGSGYAPGPSFGILRQAFRPFAVIVRERLSRVFDDQPIRHTVTLVNDTGGRVAGMLSIRLVDEGRTLWSHTDRMTLAQGETRRTVTEVPPLPAAHLATRRIETRFHDTAGVFDVHRRLIRVTPAAARRARWECGPVAVFGDDPALLATLRAHRVRVHALAGLERLDPKTTPVLLVARDAIRAGTTQHRDIESFLQRGGRAVILEQHCSPMPQVALAVRPAERACIRGGSGDLLVGLSDADFEFWGNDPAGLTASDAWVAEMPYVKPEKGNHRVLLALGGGSFGRGGYHWTPLFETRVGRGMALACQLRLSTKLQDHPIALALLERMLVHAAEWTPPKPRAFHALDAGAAKLLARRGITPPAPARAAAPVLVASGAALTEAHARTLASRAAAGATALVLGLPAAAARRLSHAFGITLRVKDLGPQFCLTRATDHPLLEGISNQESFWIERVTYASPDNKNVPIADGLIDCPQGEALLVSETESCWREFFEYGAGTEWIRTPVITHYLWNGPREHAAALLRVPYGRGEMLLSTLNEPPEGFAKGLRLWSGLLSNLGLLSSASLFEGDAVRPGSKCSDGWPSSVLVMTDPQDDTHAAVLKAALPQGEVRVPNQQLAPSFPWREVKLEAGVLSLESDASDVIIAFQINPGRPRKAVRHEGAFPDPVQQTLLDITGTGRVEVTIGGREYDALALGDGSRGTVPDIDLDMCWTVAVLRWQPRGGRSLQFQWRTRHGEPEIEFSFLGRGW